MFPSQGVLSLHVVIEGHGLPIIGSVAGLAGFPERSFMNIVFLVTAEAVEGRVLEGRGGVAGFAIHRGVFAQKREAAFLVIEDGLSPRLFCMTGVAAGAFLAAVWVVFLVTAIAICRDAMEAIIGMAGLAGDVSVFTGQGVVGCAMVEANVFPGLLGVAGGTSRAGAATVFVILLMTVMAC